MINTELIQCEVNEASQQWIMAFNMTDIKTCVETYMTNAVMDSRPMGRYEGREAIYKFWDGFVSSTNAGDLSYSEVDVQIINENTAKLSAKWSMNVGRGFISEELWVNEGQRWFLSYDDFTVEEQFN